MKKRPLIGITPAYDYPEMRMFLRSAYTDGIISAGGMPTILAINESSDYLHQYINEFDGFVLSGGLDVDATLYGEENLAFNGALSPERDTMELQIVRLAVLADKPVLGICRGAQVINVAMGGTLYQDIHSQFSKVLIKHSQDAPKWHPTHKVAIENDSHLSKIFEKESIMVNSYHHQAVKDIAPDFKATAFSPDGLIEGIEHKNKKFVIGVQWHPELMWQKNPEMLKLFQYFVKKCSK